MKLKPVIFSSLLLLSPLSWGDALISWTAPTIREDGTPLPASEIGGYRLEWTLKGVPQTTVTAPPGTTYNLVAGVGRVCVTLRTVDTDGLESDPTLPVCKNSRPNKPGNFSLR